MWEDDGGPKQRYDGSILCPVALGLTTTRFCPAPKTRTGPCPVVVVRLFAMPRRDVVEATLSVNFRRCRA